MSYATVHSCTLSGIQALPVTVEIHLAGGLPGMSIVGCLLYTSPSPRDGLLSRMPSSA